MKNNSSPLNLTVRYILLSFTLVLFLFPSVSSAQNTPPRILADSPQRVVEGRPVEPAYSCFDTQDGQVPRSQTSVTALTPTTGLVAGDQARFRISCTDSQGLTRSAEVTINIIASAFPPPPTPTTTAPAGTPPGGLVPCDGVDCGSCELVQLAQRILTWLIGVMLVIFAMLVAWAGFGLVTSGGNPAAKTDAKKKMINAFVGIIIVLAAWIFVDTLMRALLPGGTGPSGRLWSEIECTTQRPTSLPVPGPAVVITPPPTLQTGCILMTAGSPIQTFSCSQRGGVLPPYSVGCTNIYTSPPLGQPINPSFNSTWECDMTISTPDICRDDAALMARYGGSPLDVEAPGLRTMINCYMSDPEVSSRVDASQIYTIDRTNPRCSLTNGNRACGPCSHSIGSMHYGRGSGLGAMAVDFNATGSETELRDRLIARNPVCGGTIGFEGSHTHISL